MVVVNFFAVVGGEVDHLGLVNSQLFRQLLSQQVVVTVRQIAQHSTEEL